MVALRANVVSRVLKAAGFTKDWNEWGSYGYRTTHGEGCVVVRWTVSRSASAPDLEAHQQLHRMVGVLEAKGYVVTSVRRPATRLIDGLRVTSGGES